MKNEIVIPILNNEYKVIVCWGSSRDIERILKDWHYPKQGVEEFLLNRRGACLYHSECHPVIVLPEKPTTATQIGTLAHEAVHAIENIFDKIGQPLGNEIFAHSVGAVVRTVLKSNIVEVVKYGKRI